MLAERLVDHVLQQVHPVCPGRVQGNCLDQSEIGIKKLNLSCPIGIQYYKQELREIIEASAVNKDMLKSYPVSLMVAS